MAEKSNYFVLRAKAVPEVLLKVVEAKRLLDSGKLESVQEATDAAEAPFTNIRMIFSLFMRGVKERQ